MTRADRQAIAHLARQANAPKHALMEILRHVEELSPAQAKGLERAIAALERWQNTGARVGA